MIFIVPRVPFPCATGRPGWASWDVWEQEEKTSERSPVQCSAKAVHGPQFVSFLQC